MISYVSRWLRTAVTVIIAATTYAAVALAAVPPTAEITDLIYVPTELANGVLYVATSNGELLAHPIGNDPTNIATSDFERVWQREGAGRLAIAPFGRKIVVCDRRHRALLVFDPRTNSSEIVASDLPIKEPVGIAVQTDRSVVIADGADAALVVVSLNSSFPPRRVPMEFTPRALVAYANGLIALDSADGTPKRLARIRGDDERAEVTVAAPFPPFVTNLQALTEYNGIVYGSGSGGSVVFAAAEAGAAYPVPSTWIEGSTVRFAAAPKLLYSLDAVGTIRSTPRIVTATVTFRGEAGDNLAALVEFYRELHRTERLPLRAVTATRSHSSLADFLFAHGVLLPANVIYREHEVLRDPARNDLVALVCTWNPNRCSDALTIATPIPAGEMFTLPVALIRRDIAVAEVKLGGRSVSALLRDRLSSPEERSLWPAARLSGLNKRFAGTVEGVFNKLGYVVATPPRPSLSPGTAFVGGLRERVEDTCRSDVVHRAESIGLPVRMSTLAATEVLPQVRQLTEAAFQREGIVRVEVQYVEPMRERQVDDSPNGIDATRLLQCTGSPGGYVVREAIRARQTLIRFFDAQGVARLLRTEDIKRMGLRGHADPDGSWSVVVDEPLYIAYRADEWSTNDVRVHSAGDIAVIKPGAAQDIMSVTTGVIVLPVERWSLAIAATSAELDDTGSALNRIDTSFEAVSIYTEEALQATPLSVTELDDEGEEAANREETVRTQRRALRERIGFDDSVAASFNETVAIVEAEGSVDYEHHEFFREDGTSVWLDIDGFGSSSPKAVQRRPRGAARAVKESDIMPNEHGTHMAGLLVAQDPEFAPGLLPSASIALVDTTSPATVERTLRDATAAGVKIFGMSFGWTKLKPTARATQGLLQLMAAKSALYVVAAGDYGQPVSACPFPVIGWLPEFTQKAIGVAAVQDWKLLGRYDTTPPKLQTNWGSRYVQLVAPGRDVFSTAFDGAYGPASGTSPAVPQVVAAAALLWPSLLDPAAVKARLIYTAAPPPTSDFDEQQLSWGGHLDVRAALAHLQRNTLRASAFGNCADGRPCPAALRPVRTTELKLNGGKFHTPDGWEPEGFGSSKKVRLSEILRITRGNGMFRVIFLDRTSRQMYVLYDVTSIEGNMPCADLDTWRPDYDDFVQKPAATKQCQDGKLDWNSISDYTAAVTALAGGVKFKKDKDDPGVFKLTPAPIPTPADEEATTPCDPSR